MLINENTLINITNNPKILALFIVIILWSLIWKGVALWKAAKADDKKWFVALLLINTLGLLEIIYIFTERKKFRILWIAILAIIVIIGMTIVVDKKVFNEEFILPGYSRIVYGTTVPDEKTMSDWRADCSKKLGEFNECGSPCEKSAETCITVCAYTCEKIPQN